MISTETAKRILDALGPDSITVQSMNATELARDLEGFQSERTVKNSYCDWLSTILSVERIHLETDSRFNTPESIAHRDEQLDSMRRRVYAVKLTGDEMKSTKKKTARNTVKETKSKHQSKPDSKPVATATISAVPKVGDPGLATEADFTSPLHERLSDYRYYALLDKDGRIVGRGFLARVGKAPRRTWFALRNEEQTKLWETSKWAIKEISLEFYKKLTLAYLKKDGYPKWEPSVRAANAA